MSGSPKNEPGESRADSLESSVSADEPGQESVSQSFTRPRSQRWRLTAWLSATLLVAVVAGVLFAAAPARFRLLGIFGMVQGLVVGAAIGAAVRVFRIHHSRLVSGGAFLAGVASFTVTLLLSWQSWATQLRQARESRPDAAMVAQMLARMEPPPGSESEQLEAYENTRRQFAEFLESHSAKPDSDLRTWLVHRASSLSVRADVAVSLVLIELILAGVACSLVAGKAAAQPFCMHCRNWRRVIRSHSFAAPLSESFRDVFGNDLLPNDAELATVELSGCGCQQRPHIQLSVIDSQQNLKADRVELSESGFQNLKRLLDEAQSME